MWEFFFCLTPSMLLFSVAVLYCSKWIHCLVEEGTRKLTRGIWIIICAMLKLPHPSVLYATGDQDVKIKLIYKPTALASYVIQNCKALARAPLAKWPKADPHLQFFFNFILPIEEDAQGHCGITFTRDHLLIQDGGIVALDWAVRIKDQDAQAKREYYPGERAPGGHTSTPPIIILIPNALGKITRNLLSLCGLALQQGFYPVYSVSSPSSWPRGMSACYSTLPGVWRSLWSGAGCTVYSEPPSIFGSVCRQWRFRVRSATVVPWGAWLIFLPSSSRLYIPSGPRTTVLWDAFPKMISWGSIVLPQAATQQVINIHDYAF